MQHLLAFLDEQLVPDWRQAWSWLSIKFDAFFAAAIGVWMILEDDQKQALADLLHLSPSTMILIGIVVRVALRLKQQPEAK